MIKRYLCTQNLEIMLPLPPHLTTLHGLSFNALALPFYFSVSSPVCSLSPFSLFLSLFSDFLVNNLESHSLFCDVFCSTTNKRSMSGFDVKIIISLPFPPLDWVGASWQIFLVSSSSDVEMIKLK